MKIIVTGGKGHIGTYLCPMLAKAGHQVICITRGNSQPYEPNPAWRLVQDLHLDRSKTPDFAAQIAALEPDVVVDLVNFTLADTKAMVAALQGRVSHYLYCSSCWAHGRAQVLPLNPDDLRKEPLDEYGRQKFASEQYLKGQWRQNGFPATIIMPGQISGPGWVIINPWGNTSLRPFALAAAGQPIRLPNFGMETLHHVHGKDVARLFYQAIVHRTAALGESFDAVSGQSITLYGYARHLYDYFGQPPQIDFLPWPDWRRYEGDEAECSHSYYHLARSGTFSPEKARRRLDYRPQYTNLETIDLAVDSYVARGLVGKLEKK